MKHSFIDKYSDLNSMIHKLDPRTKIIGFLTYVILVVLTPTSLKYQLIGNFAVIMTVIILSKIPLTYIIKRSLVVIPFVVFVSIFMYIGNKNSFNSFAIILAKPWLALLAMIVLSSTTKFSDLLKGLDKLFVPKIFIMLLSFMYRYIFLLIDEAMRMERARNSRYFGGNLIYQIKIYANIIGILFIRTFERGERVYTSMTARGFDAEIKTLNMLSFSKLDYVFFFTFLGSLMAIKFLINL